MRPFFHCEKVAPFISVCITQCMSSEQMCIAPCFQLFTDRSSFLQFDGERSPGFLVTRSADTYTWPHRGLPAHRSNRLQERSRDCRAKVCTQCAAAKSAGELNKKTSGNMSERCRECAAAILHAPSVMWRSQLTSLANNSHKLLRQCRECAAAFRSEVCAKCGVENPFKELGQRSSGQLL